MTNPVKIGIVGVGGFGKNHLESISGLEKEGIVKLEAAVIRRPEVYLDQEQKLLKKNVRIYRSYDEMFEKEKNVVELIAIPGGISEHEPQSVAALKAGYHVMCEKPVAGTTKEALNMRKAAKESGKILAIGFQNIYAPSIQNIKEIAISGRLGKLLRLKCYATWPRSSAYYKRNRWAGEIEFEGKKIYDSPLQNATAHYLHLMLYLSGETLHDSGMPQEIYMEAYRAKPINTADTMFVHVKTKNGTNLQFGVSHATMIGDGPHDEFYFENGKITWNMTGDTHVYKFENGSYHEIEHFDNGGCNLWPEVFRDTAYAIRENRQPKCTIDNAYQHTVVIETGFEKSIPEIYNIPEDLKEHHNVEKEDYDKDLDVSNETHTVIKGIDDIIKQSYREEKSFYETGASWAKPSKNVTLKD